MQFSVIPRKLRDFYSAVDWYLARQDKVEANHFSFEIKYMKPI